MIQCLESDAGKTALFWSSFPHVLEFAQPDITRKDATAEVQHTLRRQGIH